MSDRIAIFNLGGIVQIGTPAQVYEEPADEFVAGFVGTSNILRRDGKRLVLRPEKVGLRPLGDRPAEAGLHVEEAEIVEAIYVGQFTRFLVRLDDGSEITTVRQNSERSTSAPRETAGMKVLVAWRPDHLFELR
jgi:putative spermidine/putrescine transport system ATP-binding protein